MDKAAGAERETTGRVVSVTGNRANGSSAMAESGLGAVAAGPQAHMETLPATEAARQWAGWGTALKPALEPITVARKPLGMTVAECVLAHGTGGLNIDGCRVATDDVLSGSGSAPLKHGGQNHRPFHETAEPRGCNQSPLGRWPANLITSHPRDEYRLRDDVTPGQLEELAGWLRANA